MISKNAIKWIVILITTLIYVSFSLKIGYWLTGDIHSGGPLIGLFLTPVVTLTTTVILFFDKKQIRERTILILLTFLFFILYIVSFNALLNFLALKIYKEYYIVYEHSTLISSTKWVLIILLTLITYLIIKKIIIKKITIP